MFIVVMNCTVRHLANFGKFAYSDRTKKPAANDTSMDPVITFAIQYLHPLPLAGLVFAIGLIA